MAYDDYDDEGVDFVYPLTIFFILGIWLVISRYRAIHNRAIPFRVPVPQEIKPTWDSTKIPNAHLESHLQHHELLPPMPLEERRYLTCFDPSTSLHIATLIADDSTEIERKIARAVEAQTEFAKSSFRERRRLMRSLKKWLVDNQQVCAKVACRDTGKTLIDAALGEIMMVCSKLEWLMNNGERVLSPETRSSSLLLCYKKSQVYFEPLGTVAAIVSWNYPLHNAWSPIIAALFAGNSIVVKCSEHVIWSTNYFVGALKECLRVCGHDPDLVQLVCCYPEEADTLTSSPLIKHILFIGSEEVGRKVAIAATRHLTPITLELGGKDPAIIMPSTDLKQWSSLWMRAVFQNVGQNCIGLERFIVHESQYQELYDMLAERARDLRLGSALASDGYVPIVDCGAMISAARFDDLERVIQNAYEAGADIDLDNGGSRYVHPYLEHGSYFRPTVVGNVSPESEIAQRELFAPVVVILTYSVLDEAVEIANGTRYGLGASVFGPDQEQCLKIAKRLHCGMVSVNDFGVFYANQDMPFGGTKASGFGRFGGPEGLRSLTNPKAVITDRMPWLIQTAIPKQLDYPIKSVAESWEFISGLIGFLYGDGWRTRTRSLMAFIRAARR